MSSSPKLGLTTARQTITAVLSGAAVGFVIVALFDVSGGFPPVVPWSVPIVLLLLAVAAFVYARALPKRLDEKRVSSQEALGALVTAKAMIMTGAILAGGHVVYVMRYVHLMQAPSPSARVLHGTVTILVSVLVAAVGVMLERACLVPGGPDDEDDDEGALPAAS
ncbi:DUF3180 domain-containing protein [Tessaracoccus caeni]|uniref:DUF3180 domain-containing protein n=1 Tax=Tessaracoccus caeni TaxID=3031239 RepID=UPI0023DA7C7A|nr:DUF3180 domain-containing protein [Tessaracoccus caeni]MDF1487730.1 DUF3180 domain-containing protein [Tessaracoccus caeni]